MKVKRRYFLILFFLFLPLYFSRLYFKLAFVFQAGDRVKIRTQLTQEPTIANQNQYFKTKGILIKTSSSLEFHYGDQLEIMGIVNKNKRKSFLDQFEIINPQITKIKSSNRFLRTIFQFRQRLEQVINQTLPEPQASLLSGIFLGIQKTLAYDFYQALKTTGTLHIIVASGMNISLLAGSLGDFLSRFLKRKPALIVSLVCILIYCFMAGMNPPIIRAGLMASALYLANFTGREADGLWILILTGGMMLFINPLFLFDIGFQLSFMATAGLITLTPFFQKLFFKIPFIKIFNEPLSETLGAIIFTAPILIITFGQFNPLAIIPNTLILWLIPYLLYLGLLISMIGLFFGSLAQFLAWLAWLPLTYVIQVIKFFGKFKLFDLRLENFSWIFGLGYYLVLFACYRINFKSRGLKKKNG